MKEKSTNLILLAVLLTGISLLLYPTVADYWNSFHQTRAVATYTEAVTTMDNSLYETMWQEAADYNAALAQNKNRFIPTDEETALYNSLVNIGGSGVMGVVEIPSIKVKLPIYHGVDEAVLQIATGHIQGTSLPVGGPGTHCAISGHRGLPSARLFTALDELREGDLFYLKVLDETLTYQVDQIRIVLPSDIEQLDIVEGRDLCTLITCTPYGINTHRLLVRGFRVETAETAQLIRVTADAMQIEPVLVAPALAAPMLLVLFVVLLVTTSKRFSPAEREKTKQKLLNLNRKE